MRLPSPILTNAAPVAASTPHPKYVNDVHHNAAGTKALPNKTLVKTGEAVCSDLKSGTSFTAEAESLIKAAGNEKVVTTKMLAAILKFSVIDLCPVYRPEMEAFENGGTTAPPTSAPRRPLRRLRSLVVQGRPRKAWTSPTGRIRLTSTSSTLPFSAYLPVTPNIQYFNVSAQLQGPDGNITCTTTVVAEWDQGHEDRNGRR